MDASPDLAPSNGGDLILNKSEIFDESSSVRSCSPNDKKSPFKNAEQAKKRLQAYALGRNSPLPTSPLAKKPKLALDDELKVESPVKSRKKSKSPNPDPKVSSVIEEVEENLEIEQDCSSTRKRMRSRSKSRSQSSERHFKKINKNARNYRLNARFTPSPDKQRKALPKKSSPKRKYPKSWKEFNDFGLNFESLRDFNVQTARGRNEIKRQLLFQAPALLIDQVKMKCVNREEKSIPFSHLRYTNSSPIISFSINHIANKECYLSRREIFQAIPHQTTELIEQLYKNHSKFKVKSMLKRVYFPKHWRKIDDLDHKNVENSIGLSFLQSYSDDEDNVIVEEEKYASVVKDKKTDKLKKKEKIEKKSKKGKKNRHKKVIANKKKRHRVKNKRKSTEVEELSSSEEDSKVKKKRSKKRLKKKSKLKETQSEEKKSKKNRQCEEVKIVDVKKNRFDKKEKMRDEKIFVEKKLAMLAKIEGKSSKFQDEKTIEIKMAVKCEKMNDEFRMAAETEEKTIIKDEFDIFSNEEKPKTIEEKMRLIAAGCEITRSDICQSKKIELITVRDLQHQIKIDNPPIRVDNKKKQLDDSDRKQSNIDLEQTEIKDFALDLDGKKNRVGTPDTDEYHSLWESDDEIQIPRHKSDKLNRSWESDEEMFERERSYFNQQQQPEKRHDFGNLEIPLDIKKFSKRRMDYNNYINTEMKLLEKDRRSLSEERKKLEMEKERIQKLEEEIKKIASDEKTKIVEEINQESLNNSILSTISSGETTNSLPPNILENEYEEFMKSLTSSDTTTPSSDVKSNQISEINSDTSDSNFSLTSPKEKLIKSDNLLDISIKSDDLNSILIENPAKNPIGIPLAILLPGELLKQPPPPPPPLPVPSPAIPDKLFNSILDVNCDNLNKTELEEKDFNIEDDPVKPFVFNSITLPNRKKKLVRNVKLNFDDDEDDWNCAEFTEQFSKGGKMTPTENKLSPTKIVDDKKIAEISIKSDKISSERCRSRSPKEGRRRNSRDRNKSRREFSPKKRYSSSSSPKRSRRSPPLPPPKRKSSPSRRRYYSPRRRRSTPSRSPSPNRMHRRKRSRSKSPRSPPSSSPLVGFKRSVADSTISDDMLLLESRNDNLVTTQRESPDVSGFTASPKRMPLDDRINQVLGIEKEEPKQIPTVYSTNYDNYSQFGYNRYNNYAQSSSYNENYISTVPTRENSNINFNINSNNRVIVPSNKVVQVGNILHVVPTEEMPRVEELVKTALPPVKQIETGQKIVQVGNMLQIVPGTIVSEPVKSVIKIVEEPCQDQGQGQGQSQMKEKQNAEAVMRLKSAERKAERERRRLDKEKRRKEKEKKRREKEKRRQMKIKLKTENMIKKALQLETENTIISGEILDEENIENQDALAQWPPIPLLISNTNLTNPNKSILSKSERKLSNATLKCVQFADGVRPGEGTSPSGGEELSSPPPAKLPKEKRYRKTKIPKKSRKKTIKVKVIKKPSQSAELDDDNDDEEDNLPPPSPPPGSPPPHVFPSRVKTHTINNVHPSFIGGISALSQPTYRPQIQLIMNPPHRGPPGGPPHHHPPGFLPPGPPHHHHPDPHCPTPPHHHGPPPPHHHGPPPPHHHGPPPPPHHHGPPPPHHHGPPPHHHHH